MRVLFVCCTRLTQGSMNVCQRNVHALVTHINTQTPHQADFLSIISSRDACSEAKLQRYLRERVDVICFLYSSWYVHKDSVGALIAAQPGARIGFISTDYEITPWHERSFWSQFDFILAGFEESIGVYKGAYKEWYSANLNTLIVRPRNAPAAKRYPVVYFGRYREDRHTYFTKYFRGPELMVSTSKKNVKDFQMLGCRARWIDALAWSPGCETLQLASYHLYIEDRTSHEHFTNLPNRFYEALYCNVVPLVDRSCAGTIAKGGHEVPEELYVDSYDELIAKAKRPDLIDREAWLARTTERALDERKQALDQSVRAIFG